MRQPDILPIGELGTRPRKHRRGPVVVCVPGEDVTGFACKLPDGVKVHVARNIALNAAHDRVAGAAQAHHFTVLRPKGGQARVLVVARDKLEGWRAALAASGLRAPQLLPDYLCLPWTSGTITVGKLAENRLSVRTGEDSGFTAETDLALKMLDLARAQQKTAPEYIALWPADAMEDAALVKAIEDWKLPVKTAGSDVSLPPANLIDNNGMRAALGSARARGWIGLIAAGLAAVAFWSLNAQADLADAKAQRASIRASNMQLAREVFGVEGPILDLQVQVVRRLETLRAARADTTPALGFADLLRPAGQVLIRDGVQVVELHYDDNGLRILVRIGNFAQLEELRRDLARRGLTADVRRSVREGTEGVRAELHLSAAANEG